MWFGPCLSWNFFICLYRVAQKIYWTGYSGNDHGCWWAIKKWTNFCEFLKRFSCDFFSLNILCVYDLENKYWSGKVRDWTAKSILENSVNSDNCVYRLLGWAFFQWSVELTVCFFVCLLSHFKISSSCSLDHPLLSARWLILSANLHFLNT